MVHGIDILVKNGHENQVCVQVKKKKKISHMSNGNVYKLLDGYIRSIVTITTVSSCMQ